MTAGELINADRRTLRALLASGHPIEPEALSGWRYRGISLGMPGWIDQLAWKTFVKCFVRDPGASHVRGWNVRIRQTGFGGPIEPLLRHGEPFTFGHFRVVEPRGYRMPPGSDRGLLLDYGRGGNPALDPTSRLRDPIVALAPGSADLLLGWSYLDLGVLVPTPSFFTLERHSEVTDLVTPPRG